MSTANLEVLGAYKVELTAELLRKAMNEKYGGLNLSAAERINAEKTVQEELSDVVLLDVLAEYTDKEFKVGDFSQPGTDQAAYNEIYLSVDGKTILSKFKKPDINSYRVLFFLHYFDSSKRLQTSYGEIAIPDLLPMPAEMALLIPYEPIS